MVAPPSEAAVRALEAARAAPGHADLAALAALEDASAAGWSEAQLFLGLGYLVRYAGHPVVLARSRTPSHPTPPHPLPNPPPPPLA